MSLHHPMRTRIEEMLAQAQDALAAGSIDDATWSLLGLFAALGREKAQVYWLLHHDSTERDERMQDEQDKLVFEVLKSPWSKIYPELPGQIEGMLRDSFDDEFFRLEDPAGWAVMSADAPASKAERKVDR